MTSIKDNVPEADTHETSDQQIQLVTFWIGDEEFAVDILAVCEINRMLDITRVPDAPPNVEGVINLRGLIVPIVDMRKMFNSAECNINNDTRIIVVEVSDRMIGFIVDRVNEVLRLDKSIVEPVTDISSSKFSQYISGIGKLDDRLLILLQVDRLLADSELKEIENAAA